MKKYYFIPGLLLLLFSVSCLGNANAIRPDESVSEQIYLPVINEDTSNKLPEDNLDSIPQDQPLVETESAIQEDVPSTTTPTPALLIEQQEPENNSIIVPFNDLLQPPTVQPVCCRRRQAPDRGR